MLRGLTLFAGALGFSANVWATSLTCSLNNVAQGCYTQAQFSQDPTLSWLSGLGAANQGLHSGPWATSNQAVNVTLSSPGLMQRSDNTAFAWDGLEWTLPAFVPGGAGMSTFAGRFAAPNQPCIAGPPTCSYATSDVGLSGGQFGDYLVGVLGGAPLTITFDTPVTSAGFLVSARTLLDFTATLQAYDSQNNLIGTYAIVASGMGGTCTGLTTFLNGMPQPCTGDNAFYAPSPFIGFVAPANQQITRLVLQTNDNSGLFIDQMYYSSVPEPSTVLLLSGGFGLLAWLRRRHAWAIARPS